MPLIGKKIEDTLIYYQLDYECPEIEYAEQIVVINNDILYAEVPIDYDYECEKYGSYLAKLSN